MSLPGWPQLPAGAQAAGVDGAVGAQADPVDPRLESLGEAEDRALVLAVDLLQVGALEPAIGDVTEHHLPGERAALHEQRGAGGVGDLVVRQPQHGRGHQVVVERAVRFGVVVEEPVLLDVHQFRGGQPAALVVRDEQLVPRTPADPVGGAQTAGDVLDLAGGLVDLDGGAPVPRRLRVGGGAAVVDGDGQVEVEVAAPVEQPERELVEVAAERPGRHGPEVVGDLVAVGVVQLHQPGLLRDVEFAVHVLDAHGLLQPFGDLLDGHLRGRGLAGDVAEQVDLAELVLRTAPRGDRQPAVGQPVHRGHLRLETGRAQVGEREVRVYGLQRQPVAGGVGAALALLAPRAGDPHHVRVRAQHRGRHEGEAGGARGLPLQLELLAVQVLEVVDAQRVVAGGQGDRAVDGDRPVPPVVGDHDGVVDAQPGAVVAGQPELVRARRGDVDVADGLGDEHVGQAEVGVGGPVDRGHQLVHVGGLTGLERAELGQFDLDVVGAQGDARLLRRHRRLGLSGYDQVGERGDQ